MEPRRSPIRRVGRFLWKFVAWVLVLYVLAWGSLVEWGALADLFGDGSSDKYTTLDTLRTFGIGVALTTGGVLAARWLLNKPLRPLRRSALWASIGVVVAVPMLPVAYLALIPLSILIEHALDFLWPF